MAYDIRPLSFSEILERAFLLLRNHFALLVGIAAVVWIPYGVMLGLGRIVALIGGLLFLVAAPVMQVALTIGIAGAYLDREMTVGAAYEATRPIFGSIVLTYLLLYLLLLLCLIALLVPALYFGVCWALVGPIMIVERRFGMEALSRSRALVRGSWWRTLGIMLVAGLIAEVPAVMVGLALGLLPFIGQVVTAGVQAVTSTYAMAAAVVYYFDRRCRVEGFDLLQLAEKIGPEAGFGASLPNSSSPL